MKKLLLCSGPHNGPFGNESDWFRLDCDPQAEPDCVATVPPLPEAITSQKWDTVALIHGIEHFYIWEACELLKEIRGVLAEGGEVILEQPNLAICAEHLNDPVYLGGIYGDLRHESPAMVHKFGYTPNMLGKLLERAGYSEWREEAPRFHHPERDFRMVARA